MKLNPGSAGRLTGFIFSPLNTLNNTEKGKYPLTTKIHEKEQIHFTMKNMKEMKLNPGAPVV